MAEQSSFFNAVINNGIPDRVYKAESFANYFGSFIENGIFPNPNTNLQVVGNNSNMSIVVKRGKAWINGYYYHNTDDLTLKLDLADGVLKRIDRVVIRLDFTNREMTTKIKKGELSSYPVPPTLQRDESIYELGIADIAINSGVMSVSSSDITDTRMNSDLCGMVNSLIKVDSSILTDKLEEDFYTWLESIEGILSEDEIGSISLRIQQLENNINNIEDIIGTQVSRGLAIYNIIKSKLGDTNG